MGLVRPRLGLIRSSPFSCNDDGGNGDTTFLMAIFVYVVMGNALPAAALVDQTRAQQLFKEVQWVTNVMAAVWGVSLRGLGDTRTQTFATSQPALEGARPRLVGLVNAPV